MRGDPSVNLAAKQEVRDGSFVSGSFSSVQGPSELLGDDLNSAWRLARRLAGGGLPISKPRNLYAKHSRSPAVAHKPLVAVALAGATAVGVTRALALTCWSVAAARRGHPRS